jgi:hypothetical protein
MSLAPLVITAVTVEGRAKSAVAPRLRHHPVLGAKPGQTPQDRRRGRVRASV